MKKRIIVSITCIAVAVIYVDAQNKSTTATPPVTAMERFVAAPPPPPPPPPVPPAPPLPPSIEGIDRPAPPSPMPPVPATEVIESGYSGFSGAEIINGNGYEISVRTINGKTMVIVKKDGKTQKIKLSTWNANRKYYEKKYGQLPPPPPPPPVIEEVEFTPPVIKTDN